MEVFVNGNKVQIYRGMKVKHALIAIDQAIYTAAMKGAILVVDENGFTVGLDGELSEGARIFTRINNK